MTFLSILSKERAAYERREDLQDLFACRYAELIGWALQFTDGDRSAAEELVHDAYVDLARALPDIRTIANLNGYLYNALRNLNFSRIRRAWKHRHEDIDLLEYESLPSRLRSGSVVDTRELQEYLLRLCLYLCWRKESVRSASILLLRFFRNYYPEEIARLSHMSRNAVDVQIGRARKDAKHYLEHSEDEEGNSAFQAKLADGNSRDAVEIDVFLRRLLMVIRSSRKGECFSVDMIEAMWGPRPTAAPDTAQLAHLVSCEECLKKVSRLTGSDRKELPFPGKSKGTRRNAKQLLADAEETLREIFDHQPSLLVLAVNGVDVLKCKVTAEAMDQVIPIPSPTTPEFVEVFNQTGRRLLKLDILNTPPEGPATLHLDVPLAAGNRTLTVTVEWYGPEPRLRLQYSNTAENSLALHEPNPDSAMQCAGGSPVSSKAGYGRKAWVLFPVFASVLILAIGTFVYERLQLKEHHPPLASAILEQSMQAEKTANSQPWVSHRIIAFEERGGDGVVVKTGRVEIWRAQGRIARRLYDAQGKLIAGEWRDSNGTETTLSKGHLTSHAQAPDCLQAEQAWACELSSASLAALGQPAEDWSISQDSGEYVLRFKASDIHSVETMRLVSAELHIDRQSMRSHQAVLQIGSRGVVREYRYTEVSYEPHTNVRSDSPLLRPDTSAVMSHRHASSPLLSRGTDARLAHLQLQALVRLHTLGEDAGQRVMVDRKPGRLSIHGVLATDLEANRIRVALADLVQDRSVEERIYSVNEIRDRQRKGERITFDSLEAGAGQSPASSLLRAHFQALGYQGKALDEQMEAFTQATLNQSAQVLQRAWNLREFARGFRPQDLSSFSPEDRQAWFGLFTEHTESLNGALAVLHHSIEWMSSMVGETGRKQAPSALTDPASITMVIDRVLSHATELDRDIRTLLLVSSDSGNAPPVRALAIQEPLDGIDTGLGVLEQFSRQYSTALNQRTR